MYSLILWSVFFTFHNKIISFLFNFLRQGFSGKTGSLQTHCLPKTGPELLNLLIQPPWCWGHVCEPIPPCLCGAEAGALVSACEASTPAAELRITLSVIFPVDHTQRYSEQLPVRSE